jgi:hypothetical protein
LEAQANQALDDLVVEAERLRDLVVDFPNSNDALAAYGNDLTEEINALQGAISALPFDNIEDGYIAHDNSLFYVIGGYNYDFRFIATTIESQPIPSLAGIGIAVANLQNTFKLQNPNDLLNDSAVFDTMSATIDSLRSQLDVVTNQLEEASSATTVLNPEASTLIPNVQSSNNNFTTLGALSVLSGDATQLEQSDVRPANIIAQQLEFLSSNGVEITGDLLRQLIGDLENDFRSRATTHLSTQDPLDVDGLQLARANTINLADLDVSGSVGSSDLILALGQYGTIGPDPISEAEYIDLTNNIASSYNA